MRNRFLFAFTLCCLSVTAQAQFSQCNTDLANGRIGPYDYFDPRNSQPTGAAPQGNIKRVTNVHLTKSMIRLQHGNTTSISGDLDYTLRAIPNHPDGLDLVSRLEKKLNSPSAKFDKKLKGERLPKTADCYFRRALLLAPNRPVTHSIYGIHLHRNNKYEDAKKAYSRAIELGSQNPEVHYNLGLTLYHLKEFAAAEDQAKIAYQKGYPLPGLRDFLRQEGLCQNSCER